MTALFNRNVLAVVNRELAADFDVDSFEHVARWNADEERIEMWLRAGTAQHVTIGALNLVVEDDVAVRECGFRAMMNARIGAS